MTRKLERMTRALSETIVLTVAPSSPKLSQVFFFSVEKVICLLKIDVSRKNTF